jgi:hypothetical protein
MKAALFLLTSITCFSSHPIFADSPDDSQNDILDSTSPSNSRPELPASVAYQPDPVTIEPRGLITPTVAPRVDKGMGILVDAAFIWWKSYVSNFDYAQINGNVLSPHFEFNPGFKLGTGMDLYHDGWDVYAEYTWVHQPDVKNSGTSSTPGYSTLIIPYAEGIETGILSSVAITNTTAWRKSLFNILDGEVGRNFFISKRLTLRPSIGLKAASLFERSKISYIGNGPVNSSSITLRQNLSGLGIRGGFDTMWHIIPSFGFYGNLALTALWGSFHNTFINDSTINQNAISTSYYKNTQDIIPIVEVGLGLSYMVWFKENHYQFYTKAGWEEQIWIGYNKNLINGMTSTYGSLTLQGLTVKAGLIF